MYKDGAPTKINSNLGDKKTYSKYFKTVYILTTIFWVFVSKINIF